MKIEDYLHLYIGSWITTHPNFRPNSKESVGKNGFAKLTPCLLADINEKIFPFTPKLVLRTLPDMTEEEAMEITGYNEFAHIREVIRYKATDKYAEVEYRWKDERMVDGWGYSSNAIYFTKKEWTPKLFTYLLSRGFDLFKLIEADLAINKNTIEV